MAVGFGGRKRCKFSFRCSAKLVLALLESLPLNPSQALPLNMTADQHLLMKWYLLLHLLVLHVLGGVVHVLLLLLTIRRLALQRLHALHVMVKPYSLLLLNHLK